MVMMVMMVVVVIVSGHGMELAMLLFVALSSAGFELSRAANDRDRIV
jgi:hypothetical protein